MRWLLCLLIGLPFGAACGAGDVLLFGGDGEACGEQVVKQIEEFADRWDDAAAIAQSTSRIALAGPVGDLQEIRREVERQEWPECAREAHEELVGWMDETIEAFLAFMADEPDHEVADHMNRASRHYDRLLREIERLAED